MHKLLGHQIRKLLNGQKDQIPKEFIEAVDKVYQQVEQERSWYQQNLSRRLSESRKKFRKLLEKFKQLEQSKSNLEQAIRQLRSTMDAGYDGIIQVNPQGTPTAYNAAALKLLNLSAQDFHSLNYRHIYRTLLCNAKNAKKVIGQLRVVFSRLQDSEPILIELFDGRFLECKAKALELDGQTQALVWTIRDITELKQKELEARYLAYHDELTNLPNRTLFCERLNHALELTKRKHEYLAVIFLDLDEFKSINDTLGHAQGDLLLQKVSRRVMTALRDQDTFARLGGDEFVILLENVEDRQSIVHVLDRVKQSLEQPFMLGAQHIHISPSIGVAIYPDDGKTAEELIRNADLAMYSSKKHGKDMYSFYSQQLEEYSQHRLMLKAALKHALRDNEFQLSYQPTFRLSDQAMVCSEALLRWQHKGQVVNPNEFLQEAELNGMIIPISRWVLEQVFQDIARWRQYHNQSWAVSINISPYYLQHGHLRDDLSLLAACYKVDLSRLQIELTEQSLIDDMEVATSTMRELVQLGVTITLDDFGTGYSSLNLLQKLPVHKLKIDTSFVQCLTRSAIHKELLAEVIKIAHLLKLQVVAEGVEEPAEVELLRSCHCDQAQGFWLSPPISPQQFSAQYLAH